MPEYTPAFSGFSADDKVVMGGKSMHMGPDIAWYTDPAGNTPSVLDVS